MVPLLVVAVLLALLIVEAFWMNRMVRTAAPAEYCSDVVDTVFVEHVALPQGDKTEFEAQTAKDVAECCLHQDVVGYMLAGQEAQPVVEVVERIVQIAQVR